jgi:hypothetical protein
MVVVADGVSGTVRFFLISPAGAKIVRTERLEQRPERVTAADVQAAEARLAATTGWFGSRPKDVPNGKIENAPKVWSSVSRVFASNGDLLVGAPRDFAAGPGQNAGRVIENNVWTVFPAKGGRYRVKLPSSLPLGAVLGDYAFGIPITQDGEPSVHIYRVIR